MSLEQCACFALVRTKKEMLHQEQDKEEIILVLPVGVPLGPTLSRNAFGAIPEPASDGVVERRRLARHLLRIRDTAEEGTARASALHRVDEECLAIPGEEESARPSLPEPAAQN